jgi:pimeloyl-ACP methyl ester carboxylesterase
MDIARIPHPARLRLVMRAVILAITGLAMTASQLPSAGATTTNARAGGPKPTIVLEHGAWADASSWDAVIRQLQRAGYNVDAPPDPLRGLAYDSATLADFLKTISGPIVLAGHSYGGMVITNAATGNPDVKALVYIDAYIPAQGDTAFGLTAAQPGSCLASANAFIGVPYPGAPGDLASCGYRAVADNLAEDAADRKKPPGVPALQPDLGPGRVQDPGPGERAVPSQRLQR